MSGLSSAFNVILYHLSESSWKASKKKPDRSLGLPTNIQNTDSPCIDPCIASAIELGIPAASSNINITSLA